MGNMRDGWLDDGSIERLAIGVFAELGWQKVNAFLTPLVLVAHWGVSMMAMWC